jgi:hypothetical protein
MHGLKVLVIAAGAAAAAVVSLTALGGTARADELAGSFGLGYDHALGGADGMSLKYVATPDVEIQAIVGVERQDPPGDADSTDIDIGILGAYRLMGDETVALMLGGGIDIARASVSAGGGSDSNTSVAIEVGIGPEWFVMPNVSFSARAGFILDISGQDENFGPKGLGIGIGSPNVDLTGSLGFHYYFL